jgi:hypothetical protein
VISVDLRFVCLSTMRVLPKEEGVNDADEDLVLGNVSASPAPGGEGFVCVSAKAGVDELVEGDKDLLPVGRPKEESDDEQDDD